MEIKQVHTDLGRDSASSLLTKERYSALLDGELSDQELDALLKSGDDFNDWETYGLIGDVLRSPDLAQSQVNLQEKEDFIASFRSRLKDEPLILAPNALKKTSRQGLAHWGAWLAASGFAVLVAVGIIYNVYDAPSQTGLQVVAGGSKDPSSAFQIPSGVNNSISVMQAGHQNEPGVSNSLSNNPNIHVVNTSKGALLRNSQLDPYIRAHHQFSYNPELTIPVHYAQPGVVVEDMVNAGKQR